MKVVGKLGWPCGLDTLFAFGSCVGLSDGELLERFVSGGGDPAEIAFAALVDRHGPMVLRACWTVLRDRHDAEDAFQATFLVLAHRASSLGSRDTLGPWLFRVARHVALRARAALTRRQRHEQLRSSMTSLSVTEDSDETRELARMLLDDVARLPAYYRSPIVLCHLEGASCESAARQLGLPVGTVKSRLARGRHQLRRRLARRGLAPGIASAALMTSTAFAAVPPRILAMTTRSAIALMRTPMTISTSVLSLARATWRSMFMNTILRITAAIAIGSVAWIGLAPGSPEDQPALLPSGRPAVVAGRPTLPIPAALAATAGRGGAVMYDLDEHGNRQLVAGSQNFFKETVRDLRWVAVLGTLDNRQIRGDQIKSSDLDPTPIYRRVDLERQTRRDDGGWSHWTLVDPGKNLLILDNLPEVDIERTRQEVRIDQLVDPLPFLKSGTWRGINVESFLDRRPPAEELLIVPGLPAIPETKTRDVPELMIRSLDFTVEAGTSYRYRARVVLLTSVPSDPDREESGPWSAPTNVVAVPRE